MMCFFLKYFVKFSLILFINSEIYSFDSDFDQPESEPHGEDEAFDAEAYLKWRQTNEE